MGNTSRRCFERLDVIIEIDFLNELVTKEDIEDVVVVGRAQTDIEATKSSSDLKASAFKGDKSGRDNLADKIGMRVLDLGQPRGV